MKVNIGPYTNFWGPYQIADLLQKIGVSKCRCESIGKYLAHTWLGNFLEFVDEKRKRKEKIVIHDYDTWSVSDTLAPIILPMLIQLKKTKQGAPFVADEDVPEELSSVNDCSKREEGDVDAFWFERWDYVLDKMIWSFEQFNSDWESQFHHNDNYWDKEDYEKHLKEIQKGFCLFGEYYMALWD